MTRPLSDDIRNRLILAVDGGMARRSAAQRFGVAASTAIKWVDQWHRAGHIRLSVWQSFHAGSGSWDGDTMLRLSKSALKGHR